MPSIPGTRWTGIVAGNTDPRTLPRIEFAEEGRVVGYTGCNMLSGTWRKDGDAIRVGSVATTKRLCVGPENEVERRLLAAMRPESKVTHDGRHLIFTSTADGATFEFEEAAAT
jgi:heat shock protein HslJ